MQIQTAFSGLANNDAGDLKKRVNASLARLRGTDATDFNMPPTEQNINKPPTEQMDAAQKAMAVAQASLAIDSTPAGADIEIDSAFVGNTPSTVTVDPGSHQIVVKKKGYADWVKTLTVTGGTIHLNAELETVQPQLPVAVPPPPRPN
jgi:hypothetical protein